MPQDNYSGTSSTNFDPNSQSLAFSLKVTISCVYGQNTTYQYKNLIVDNQATIADGAITIENASIKAASFKINGPDDVVTLAAGKHTRVKIGPSPFTVTYNIDFRKAIYLDTPEL